MGQQHSIRDVRNQSESLHRVSTRFSQPKEPPRLPAQPLSSNLSAHCKDSSHSAHDAYHRHDSLNAPQSSSLPSGSSSSKPSTSKQKSGSISLPGASGYDSLSGVSEYRPKLPKKFVRWPNDFWYDSALQMKAVGRNQKAVVTVGFTDRERSLLQTLWHQIARHTNIGVKFYVSLITLHPEFRQKFCGNEVEADKHIRSHAMTTLQYFVNLANYIDNQNAFNESIYALANIHKKLAISKEDLNVLNNVFLNMVIREVPDFMFPASAYALIMFLSTVTTRLFCRMEQLKEGDKTKKRVVYNRSDDIRSILSSNSEDLYEAKSEWEIQVMEFHNRRQLPTNWDSGNTAGNCRNMGNYMAPCLPADQNTDTSSGRKSKKK